MSAGTSIGLTTMMLLASLTCSEAQTLTQRQTMAHEEPKLAEEAQTASRICGTTITANFDWNSFVAANKVEDMNGAFNDPPSNMCSVPLKVLQSMCQDPTGKQAILRQDQVLRMRLPGRRHARPVARPGRQAAIPVQLRSLPQPAATQRNPRPISSRTG